MPRVVAATDTVAVHSMEEWRRMKSELAKVGKVNSKVAKCQQIYDVK